jgi:hypothetical protein
MYLLFSRRRFLNFWFPPSPIYASPHNCIVYPVSPSSLTRPHKKINYTTTFLGNWFINQFTAGYPIVTVDCRMTFVLVFSFLFFSHYNQNSKALRLLLYALYDEFSLMQLLYLDTSKSTITNCDFISIDNIF